MTDHEEELARLKAEMDQAIEGVKVMARASWAFFQESKDQGFDDGQALKLTLTWIAAATRAQGDNDE